MSAELAELFPVAQVPYLDYVVLTCSDQHAVRLVKVERSDRSRVSLESLGVSSAMVACSGSTRSPFQLTMNATPDGSSSCSEGKNAGPFLLLELRAVSCV